MTNERDRDYYGNETTRTIGVCIAGDLRDFVGALTLWVPYCRDYRSFSDEINHSYSMLYS